MSDLQGAKALVRAFYAALDAAEGPDVAGVMARFCAPDLLWRGFHPFDEQSGPEAVAQTFWVPLKSALRPLRRRLDLFFAGRNHGDGAVWVASMGHLMGLFDAPWLGIRPTRRIAMLRYAAFHRVENGAITETAMFFDIPHLMMQAGQNPFPPQTGAHLVQPGPVDHDGLLFQPQDPEEGERTLAAIEFMVKDIGGGWRGGADHSLVDELRRSWNEDMIWWGPAGIGATYTIERYAEQHSGAFRAAFAGRVFNGHVCRIAEGKFGGFFGWPNLTLQPTGGFMGMPATGQAGDMRVIDMYRREGDKLSENWVFIDLLHFWKQQGLDVLGRMQGLTA
ncbi:nuclear transport factor 2 family protein [Cribrihabitans marinus]|nr:nuclear transport factor 2 family protein [Cribrihabitans marinus]